MINRGNEIGQLIKRLRKNAGLSQLELELEIDAAQGSLSRIESGDVNPTKETLLKIIKILDVQVPDAVTLLGLNTKELIKLIDISINLNNTLDLDTVLQKSVNEVCFKLDILGAFVVLEKNGRLYAQTATQRWFLKPVYKMIGSPFKSLFVSLEDPNNLMVKTFINKKSYKSDHLSDYTTPFVSLIMSESIQKLAGVKSGISFPIVWNTKSIGAIYFGKGRIEDFINELPVLKAFTDHIAVAINNAQKYQELQEELKKIKQ